MKGYAEMSDHDINAAVASSLGVDFESHESGIYASVKWDGDNVVSVAGIVDYCNNWADAGPVILDNLICLVSPVNPRDEWIATWSSDGGMWSVNDFTCRNKNPLRAAMIVFLMMKGDETRILAPDEVSDE